MHEWMPLLKESELSWDLDGESHFIQRVDSFAYHCGLAALFGTGLDVRRDDYDYALAAKMLGIWHRASEMLLFGDYYPLTPFHRDAARAGWPASSTARSGAAAISRAFGCRSAPEEV